MPKFSANENKSRNQTTSTNFCTKVSVDIVRAGLTIGQTGKCPGPRAFGGLALEYQNPPLLVFQVFKLFTTRRNCGAF